MVRMLVTRPQPDAGETAARLEALGIEAEICPLFLHETLSTSLPEPQGFAGIALTSANALRALEDRGALDGFRSTKVFAVGDRTAQHARDMGFAEVASAGGSVADLAEMLAHAGLQGTVFYPVAREQSGDLAKSLAPFGVMVISTQVYAMNPITALPQPVERALETGTIDAALLYSRRAAETLVRLAGPVIGDEGRKHVAVLCISEAVAEPLMDAHFVRVGLAERPDEEAMMALALSFARDQNPA